SLFDSLADWMAVPLMHYEHDGLEPKRLGLNHATIAPYGAYRTGDGGQVVISIQTETEWASLCRDVLGKPQLAADPRFSSNSRRSAHRRELDAEIDQVFALLTGEALIARLRAAQIAFGKLNSVGQLAVHPQLRRLEVATPSGPVSIPAPPQIFVGDVARLGPVPAIDSHGAAIRREFGGRL
ncbi:MAG TPA: CoA transferase, partial [Roseiarcus sp.]|nr:CoA transferase [Roseiarcus sp.]